MKTLEHLGPAAQAAARRWRDGVLSLLGDNVAAIWLYGSAVFDAKYLIDLDFHVLISRTLTRPETEALETVERASIDGTGLEEIDCWFILLEDAGKPEPPSDQRFRTSASHFDDHWAFHRAHWLSGAYIVLHGPEATGIVPEPGWEELNAALLRELDAASRVAIGTPYWTLQLCRVLASLETRDVVRSKLDSGTWAIHHLQTATHPIVQAAMRYYSGAPGSGDQDLIARDFLLLLNTVRSRLARAPKHD